MECLSDGFTLIEDLVTPDQSNTIDELMHSNRFPWFLLPNMSQQESDNPKVSITLGYFHVFIREDLGGGIGGSENNSYYSNIFTDLLEVVQLRYNFVVDKILRIRGRMTLREPGHDDTMYCAPHTDFINQKDKYYSLVYYVYDSDGDTYLFNDDGSVKFRSTPIKGNMFLFDGDTVHAGNCPINSPYRTIVNYDFTIK